MYRTLLSVDSERRKELVERKVCFGQEMCRSGEVASLKPLQLASGFHQISGTGRKPVEDVVETALLEDQMDLKVVAKCNPLLIRSLYANFSITFFCLLSTHSVTAGHNAPLWQIRASRASFSEMVPMIFIGISLPI